MNSIFNDNIFRNTTEALFCNSDHVAGYHPIPTVGAVERDERNELPLSPEVYFWTQYIPNLVK